MILQDSQGRHIHKLRIQLTDACNFRCFYCMPEEAKFLRFQNLLRPQEFETICSGLIDLGVDEIRITGGEPTLRPDFDEIMTRLSPLPWKKFGITSNGFLLGEKLNLLRDLRCTNINISLDSLKEDNFNSITRRNHFQKVYETILLAVKMGFHVKTNCVVARGINDEEIPQFIKFSEDYGIEVRFLELMQVGPSIEDHVDRFISAAEMIEGLKSKTLLIPLTSAIDSTSFRFTTPNGGVIGFIASESQPFCGTCSRLRLTATGKLRACLFTEGGINLRGVDRLDYPEILQDVMALKPSGRISHITENMNQIGG